MKKGEVYEGIVEKIKFPNKGMIRVTGDGETPAETDADTRVTVKNAIPGQKISFRLTKKRKSRMEGKLLDILEKSPLELSSPQCTHYGQCGGCLYQSIPYEKELELKKEQVLELMRPVVSNVDDIFEGIHKSPRQKGYRNKMEFSFGDAFKDGPLALGMHKRGSFYDIVEVDGCQICDSDFCTILRGTAEYFRQKKTPFYHRMRYQGYLRHLLVRKAVYTDEILVDLITTTQMDENEAGKLLEGWKDMLLTLPLEGHFAGILHTSNDSVADIVQNDATEILYGRDYFFEHLLGMQFKITPFSFFQTNSKGAELLYSTARQFIGDALDGEKKTVFDLYSGTGTIAQILAPVAGKVVGVEIVEEAVQAARENAQRNGLTNCEFIAGDVLKVLDDLEEKPDYIVLDPPRDGVHPKALNKIISYHVPQMIYISCKPTSLQRDLVELQHRGYQVQRMACVDMFPGTANVETVCLLSNTRKKPYVTLDVDMDDYCRITGKDEAEAVNQ